MKSMIKPPHPQEHKKTARVGHQSPQACPPFNLIMAISNWLNFLLFLRVSIPRYFKYSHISTLNIPQDRVSTISVVENSSPGHTPSCIGNILPFLQGCQPWIYLSTSIMWRIIIRSIARVQNNV